MNLEDFNKLTDEEKSAMLAASDKASADLKEREIEIESLKNENTTFKETITKQEEDLKKTKELNYTLARNMDTHGSRMSFEDALHGLLKGEREHEH